MNESEIRTGAGFLDGLVEDLESVRPAMPWGLAIGVWVVASGLFVGITILASGPLRAGFDADLTSLRLQLEVALGAGSILAMIAACLEWGVPGAPARGRLLAPGLLLAMGWLSVTIFGGGLPGPTPSMLGKREHCFISGILIALPPTALALGLLRQRLMLAHAAAGSLAGAAAAALPAIAMQLACMYEPEHALRFHFPPIILIAIIGGAAGHFMLPRD